ncbi:MAG TPA: hypothetical protein PK685_03015 [archaeon]|jgi:hypothetical protein|nr:hypothetical protein [archaeon]
MPVIKPKQVKRPAKRIAPKTLENMRKKTAIMTDLKKLVDNLGKPNPELQKRLDENAIRNNRVPRNGLKLRQSKK